VPPNQTLPSLYLSAKPALFGAVPWPAIGPDIAAGTETGGHAFKNPCSPLLRLDAENERNPELQCEHLLWQ
jgi:hypothetical protein